MVIKLKKIWHKVSSRHKNFAVVRIIKGVIWHFYCLKTRIYLVKYLKFKPLEKLKLDCDKLIVRKLMVASTENLFTMNPTLGVFDSNINIFWRESNIAFTPKTDLYGNQKFIRLNNQIVNNLKSGILQRDFSVIEIKEIFHSSGIPSFEDPRFVSNGSDQLLVGTYIFEDGTIAGKSWKSKIGLFNLKTREMMEIDSPVGRKSEKNWVPIDYCNDNVRLLHSHNPDIVVSVELERKTTNIFQLQNDFPNKSSLNGGTPFLKIDGCGYLRVARKRFPVRGFGRIHFSYFLLYDDHLNIQTISRPFFFYKLGFEICNGLVQSGENEITLALGVDDREIVSCRVGIHELYNWIKLNQI